MAKTKPDYENRDDVPLNRVHLDGENPRHDPIAEEARIISQLVSIEKVYELAKDIAAKGGMNPLERLGVIEMPDNPGHYVTVEGNRRTCALKLLHDPRKAPNAKVQARFAELKEAYRVPTHIPVVVFKDREAARPWMSLRHLGEQNGAGTRPWDPDAKTRYSRGKSPDRLAIAVLDRAVESEWITPAERKALSVTTLTRYLKNPVVRAALGLAAGEELRFTHNAEEVDGALKHFLGEAIPRGDEKPIVNSRTKKDDWIAYAQSLHQRGIAAKNPLPAAIEPPIPSRPRAEKKPRNPPNPDNRATIAKSSFVAKHPDKNLQRLLNELRTLKPDDGFMFSANYLVRATIERILVLYAMKHKFHDAGTRDHVLVRQCHEHLAQNGAPPNRLKIMRMAASNKDLPFSLDTLGSAVHGAHLPTRKGLIAVWDNWEPCLELMLERM